MNDEERPAHATPAAETTATSPPSKSTTKIIVIAIVAILVIVAAGVGAWLIWGQNDPNPQAMKAGGELAAVSLSATPPSDTSGEVDDTGETLAAPAVQRLGSTSDPSSEPVESDSYLFQCTTDPTYQIQIGPGGAIVYIYIDQETGDRDEWEIPDWQDGGDGWIVHFWTGEELTALGVPDDAEPTQAFVGLLIDDQGVLNEYCSIMIDNEQLGWELTYEYIGPGE